MAEARTKRNQRVPRRRKQMASINVTPMVDVMLVLLVIFMVAAPMLQTGVDVDLPNSAANALPQSNEPPLALTITDAGALFVDDVPVSRDALVLQLQEVIAGRESDKIYLRADGQNSYGYVVEIMGLLSQAGLNNVALVSDVSTQGNF